MSSRYDSHTTIFSPQGRLFQVEYAMEAIGLAGAAVGVVVKDGIVLAAEKRVTSKLLDVRRSAEKMYKVDDHVACAVAGITSDANILINYARLSAQQYLQTYGEPIPIEQLLHSVCDLKQGYTQFGGLRPFGVSFLFAGWDSHHGFQLYQSDPSGNFGGWKATAIGANNQDAQALLKQEYKVDDTPTLDAALVLAMKVLAKTMDTTSPSPEKMEFVTVTLDDDGKTVNYHVFSKEEMEALLARTDLQVDPEEAAAGASGDI